MKKFLLSALFVAAFGYFNQANAQCNGASVNITNFTVGPNGGNVVYAFDWTFVNGNASINVTFTCNGTLLGTTACIPRLTDSAAGPHHVTGTTPGACNGVFSVNVNVWSSPNCGGTS